VANKITLEKKLITKYHPIRENSKQQPVLIPYSIVRYQYGRVKSWMCFVDIADKIADYFIESTGSRPNDFTIYMGNAIKKAREEAGMTQEKLAQRIYKRRATLSDMENGKTEPDASTLSLLSYYLKKPFDYFYQNPLLEELVKRDMTPLSIEMQMHFEHLLGDELKIMAINIVKAMDNVDIKNLFLTTGDYALGKMDNEELESINRIVELNKKED
jgi:transcriptional regulator with XRE-family HTH domain